MLRGKQMHQCTGNSDAKMRGVLSASKGIRV